MKRPHGAWLHAVIQLKFITGHPLGRAGTPCDEMSQQPGVWFQFWPVFAAYYCAISSIFSSLLSINVLKILINGTSHLLDYLCSHWQRVTISISSSDSYNRITTLRRLCSRQCGHGYANHCHRERTYMATLPAVMLHASNRGRSFQGILLSLYRKQ